jgi:hypothetical protein
MRAQLFDLLERAGWTALQAGIGLLATQLQDIPAWWALPIATALSLAKTWIVNNYRQSR